MPPVPDTALDAGDSGKDGITAGMPHFAGTLTLRTGDLRAACDELDWAHALALALRGEIEAVASRSGRIRYFRLLPESERPDPATLRPMSESEDAMDRGKRVGASGCIANTRLGAYRERVIATGITPGPHPGEMLGFTWALYLARV